jgi:hypothetical protein
MGGVNGSGRLESGTAAPPKRQHIDGWVQTATNSLPAQMIRNAWRHGQYSWFPELAPAPAPALAPEDQKNESSLVE